MRLMLVLAVVLLAGQQASATVMFFSDEEEFLSFEPTLVLEDFEGAIWTNTTPARALTGPLDASSTSDFAGGLEPGLVVSVSPARTNDVFLGRGGSGGRTSTAVGTNHHGARLRLEFTEHITAVSLSIYSWFSDGADQIGVDVYGSSGLIDQVLLDSASSQAPEFLAMISTGRIVAIELSRPGDGFVNLYDVAFGIVPEADTVLLLGLGLAVLANNRRRRVR